MWRKFRSLKVLRFPAITAWDYGFACSDFPSCGGDDDLKPDNVGVFSSLRPFFLPFSLFFFSVLFSICLFYSFLPFSLFVFCLLSSFLFIFLLISSFLFIFFSPSFLSYLSLYFSFLPPFLLSLLSIFLLSLLSSSLLSLFFFSPSFLPFSSLSLFFIPSRNVLVYRFLFVLESRFFFKEVPWVLCLVLLFIYFLTLLPCMISFSFFLFASFSLFSSLISIFTSHLFFFFPLFSFYFSLCISLLPFLLSFPVLLTFSSFFPSSLFFSSSVLSLILSFLFSFPRDFEIELRVGG